MTKTNNKRSKAAAAKAKHYALIEPHQGLNGCIPRGVMQKVFKEHKAKIPWLTIDLVKKV